MVAAVDGRSVIAFAKGRYQGVAADHYVEFDTVPSPGAGRVLALEAEALTGLLAGGEAFSLSARGSK